MPFLIEFKHHSIYNIITRFTSWFNLVFVTLDSIEIDQHTKDG